MSHYEYTITPSGVPLRLHMMGAELALNSHYDEYILDFKSFEALDEANEEPFGIPEECHEAAEVARRPLSLLLGALVPKVCVHRPAVDPSAPCPACQRHVVDQWPINAWLAPASTRTLFHCALSGQILIRMKSAPNDRAGCRSRLRACRCMLP